MASGAFGSSGLMAGGIADGDPEVELDEDEDGGAPARAWNAVRICARRASFMAASIWRLHSACSADGSALLAQNSAAAVALKPALPEAALEAGAFAGPARAAAEVTSDAASVR